MKKAFFIVIVIVLLVVINNLIRSIYNLWSKQDLLYQAQNELKNEQQTNKKLKGELSYVQTPQFVEKEARNELFLVKPGEQDVLIPQTSSIQAGQQEANNIPNWQKWIKLFF